MYEREGRYERRGGDVLSNIKHVPKNNAAAGHVDIKGERLGLGLGLEDLSLSGGGGGLVSSSQFSHEGISAIVVKVDARHIGVIQGTSAGTLLVVSPASAVEGRGLL